MEKCKRDRRAGGLSVSMLDDDVAVEDAGAGASDLDGGGGGDGGFGSSSNHMLISEGLRSRGGVAWDIKEVAMAENMMELRASTVHPDPRRIM